MIPAYIAAAAANPARPATDSELDADRKPAETLAFTGVKPGYTVVDFFPGGGYFSRLFSGVVGAKGKVYAFVPAELGPMMKKPLPVSGSVPDPAWPNIIALVGPVNQFATPEPVDIVFTAQNYHDLHDPFMAPADLKLFNAAVFKALKKGGLYVVLDHSAPDGSGLASTNTTHRIDADVVKAEVTAAGFRFVRAGEFLRNPADPRTALVFDKSIRHHTDQFVFLFRKP
jgi:predicted methyltransferase